MAITKTSGDGFALYNGVKLPNIDTVWTDKTKYPYVAISDNLNYGDGLKVYELYCSTEPAYFKNNRSCQNGESIVFICVDDAFAGMTGGEIPAWQWLFDFEHGGAGTGGNGALLYDEVVIYSNHNIVKDDDSIYLSASDPISLDGMTVVEWDGDIEGLEHPQYMYVYRLMDYINKPVRCAAVADDNGNLRTDFIALSASDTWSNMAAWLVYDSSIEWPWIYAMHETNSLGVSPGVYMRDGIRLFAYDINASNIHDDTWPIEWRTTEVAYNVTYPIDDIMFAKVSNLTPSTEDMRLVTVTISAFGEAKYTHEIESEGFIAYAYNNTDFGEVPIVVSDGSVFEAGIYFMNIGILGDEYDWIITLTKPDFDEETDLMPVYKRVNGTWVKQTAYQRQNGEWVLISSL